MRATKDSGFEWIGIIPSEWGLSRIGQVYRLRNTKVSDTDYPPLSVTNKGIVPQLDTAAKTNAHDDRKLVKKGDFAINSRSDRRGSCGISDYDGSVSLINTILAPLNEMNPGYYDWLFHTIQFGDEFYKFGHGIVDDLWTTGWQEMKKITIPTPPHERVLTCDFDELSENNTLNQILKTTVMLLLRNGKVQAKYKDDLKKKMLYFSNVDIIEPTGIKWSSIRFQRNNQTYRMLVSICQLIIEGMLITTDAGDYRLASFVDEQRMCRLYEKFILEYYTRHYPALSVSASQIPWSLDDGVGIMLPVMQSDIHLQRGNTVLIIDAKYYSHTTQVQFDKHTLHSNNLYQIFTYVKNRSYQFGEKENTVSGMLLYAKTEEEIQPDNVYQMHGSQISVKTLDLNLPFAEIASQMDRIVETHFSGLTKAC